MSSDFRLVAMGRPLLSSQFVLVASANFCLFLVLSSWSFLPLFVVEIGGTRTDAGMVMGSMGITSLGALPLIAPLIDRKGRKLFILAGLLATGLSNAGFLLFHTYSPLMILVRLVQGVAFISCFNACATAIVDLIPEERRGQGLGIFGVSHSLAVALGPWVSERVMLARGFHAYFMLLIGFGLAGFLLALFIQEPGGQAQKTRPRGFFSTALKEGHLRLMTVALIFGAGFGAMNTFFPLFAKTLGFKSGVFFVGYGLSLIFVRVALGRLADRLHRQRIVLACMLGYGLMLVLTAGLTAYWQVVSLGMLFGFLQGFAYPTMMAEMVDRSRAENRAVVVGLFTGSFGIGINAFVPLWGLVADLEGLAFMYSAGGFATIVLSLVAALFLLDLRKPGTADPA